MQFVSLDRRPNQRFTITEGDTVLLFTLQYFRGITFVSVTDSDGNDIVTSRKLGDGAWMLPYAYEDVIGCNYRLEDSDGECPVYGNFDGSCVMTRYTRDEAAALRGSSGALA